MGSVSKNRFYGVLFGAGVTAVIQSSTATTVMAVGFVNAGIIALPQIVGIIMGANVGTTVTGWLVSSVEWSTFLKPDSIGAVCSASGALMLLFSKEVKLKNIGEVIFGFGILFLGLSQMPAAMRPLAELEVVKEFFVTMGSNPLLAILAGILVTAVIQSSTASIGILQSLAFAGMVPWSAAVFIVLGQNVGTCLTAVLSGIGASKNAKAASYVHLVYNVVGAVIFCIIGVVFFTFIDPTLGATSITATNISMVHTGYNVAALVLLFPFGRLILKIAVKMTGFGKSGAEVDVFDLPELDESILETPSYALDNCTNAVLKMMKLMRSNLVLGMNIFAEKNYKKITEFRSYAENIDKMNDKINEFMTKLYHENLNSDETVSVSSLIHITISLRRINARSKGFITLAENLRDLGYKEPFIGAEKVNELYGKTMHCYDNMVNAFAKHKNEYILDTMTEADEIASLREEYKNNHFTLASTPGYNVEAGLAYAEAARHLARIAHNIKSVVETVPHDELVIR